MHSHVFEAVPVQLPGRSPTGRSSTNPEESASKVVCLSHCMLTLIHPAACVHLHVCAGGCVGAGARPHTHWQLLHKPPASASTACRYLHADVCGAVTMWVRVPGPSPTGRSSANLCQRTRVSKHTSLNIAVCMSSYILLQVQVCSPTGRSSTNSAM